MEDASLAHRVPPAAVALVTALAMWVVASATPDLRVPVPARVALASVLAILGGFTALAGVLEFRRARTSLNPLNPAAASALVATGIYRFSRNPMYLGIAIVVLGWAVFLSHPLSPAGVPIFVACMNRFQIAPEEQALRALFPGTFEAYARQVRRWI